MQQRPRIYYTEAQKAEMWDQWRQPVRSGARIRSNLHLTLSVNDKKRGGLCALSALCSKVDVLTCCERKARRGLGQAVSPSTVHQQD